MYTAIGRRRDVPCYDARQRCAPTVTRHGLACTLGAPLHATFKRPTRARVHDVQARQETAFVLTPWEHPSRDTVARPYSQRGCPASRSRLHRAILGARYSSPSELNLTLLASSSLCVSARSSPQLRLKFCSCRLITACCEKRPKTEMCNGSVYSSTHPRMLAPRRWE